mmetsp:Transcript_11267/g.45615  ORF Transcript_11267/g.45615 Transcript_11267/m.45615 type:complete len:630 (+) Transcript_11267:424-2313(+)
MLRGADALDAVLDLLVEFLEAVDVLLVGVPVAAAVGLEEGGDHVAEGVRVGLEEAGLHLGVLDERVVGVLVDKVVDVARGCRPAHGVAQPLGDLARALVARVEHALVELGVEQLGPRVEAHRLGQRADLRVGRRRVGHHRRGLAAVLAEALHDLGRVRVVVMRDVGQRDLRRVEVLERDVHRRQRRLEELGLLVEHAGLVGVEREALAADELVLELALGLPAAVLDGEAHICGIRARGIREDARRGVADRDAHLGRLLERVLTHEVLVERLVGFGGELDGAVQEVHLVDEEIPEDARARDDHVDARPPQLLERDELQLVDAAERVGQRSDADELEDLRERLAIRFDVVGAPQRERDGFGERAGILLEAREQLVDDALRAIDRSRRRDRLRVERVHVLAGGQDGGVPDGVAAWPRLDVRAIESFGERAELVVGDDLRQAELEVLEERRETGVFGSLREASIAERLAVGRLAAEERVGHDLGHRRHFFDAARRVGRGIDQRLDRRARRERHLLQEVDVGEDAVVGVAVYVLELAAERRGDDARQADDVVLGAVDLGDRHQSRDGLLGRRRHADRVEAHRQQAGFDLHELAVHEPDEPVARVEVEVLGVERGRVDARVLRREGIAAARLVGQ